MLNHVLIVNGRERKNISGKEIGMCWSHDCLTARTYTIVPPRELAVRCIYESTQVVTSYTDFELLLEIAFALSNDHGKGQVSTKSCYLHLGTWASLFDSFSPRCSIKLERAHTLETLLVTCILLKITAYFSLPTERGTQQGYAPYVICLYHLVQGGWCAKSWVVLSHGPW